MQTFLPYPSFSESASVLDYRRLGKQRVEVLQLLKAISQGGGWSKHPCALMWADYSDSLVEYGVAVCKEWIKRGYKDTCLLKILNYKQFLSGSQPPSWLGDPLFHASHRSNLLRKDPDYYGKYGWKENDSMPYVWPRR